MTDTAIDVGIELWKLKRLVKYLNDARGNGTSMISIIIPPRDQISRVQKMQSEEYGTATNIPSPAQIACLCFQQLHQHNSA